MSREATRHPAPDLWARVLEWGLIGVVVLAPLPLAAVGPRGRGALEIGALILLAVWTLRSLRQPTPLPPTAVSVGLAGLLLLGCLQLVPLGHDLVGMLSPAAERIASESVPGGELGLAEARLLDRDPAALDPTPTLSVDRSATASALRTGAAVIALLLIATTVGAICGARRIALAFLLSAAFQGLYGLLVLSSEEPRIWAYPKQAYLDAATGTFVNKNHFAGFLVLSLTCGLSLILSGARRLGSASSPSPSPFRFGGLFEERGIRLLLGLLLFGIGVAGLLASLSRAGIVLGLVALTLTASAAARGPWRRRLVGLLIVVALAAIPALQLGSERLVQRFASSASDLTKAGARAQVWGDTLELATDLPLAGAGFGTFASIYPLYRSPEVRLFFAHAHNDLLQIGAEAGLPGWLLLGMVLIPLLSAVFQGLLGRFGTLGVGFAAGLLAILLHGLIDFNFHIPANAAAAAIVAGTLLGMRWQATD